MSRKFLLVVLLKMMLLQASFAQTNECPGGSLPHKVFVAGYPDSARLTVDQLLKGGRLEIDVKGFEIMSFVVGASVTRGNDSYSAAFM